MLHHSNLKFNEELICRDDYATEYIILHHSEVLSRHTIEDVHKWHFKRGMAGVGYHYFIDKDGEIFEGRPHWAKGAHASGYNDKSVGVCFEGDFNKEQMSEKQENAAVMLLSILSLAYEDATVTGYRQLSDKKSPGKFFPLKSMLNKVDNCKGWLKGLFGEEMRFWIMDEEGRNRYAGLDEEADRKRQSMPSSFEDGNFSYSRILDLFADINECEYL